MPEPIGPADPVRARQRAGRQEFVRHFHGRRQVLDLGCGGGVFLDLLRDAGIPVQGVECDPVAVAGARAAGHQVSEGDVLAFLRAEPDGSRDGVMIAHLIEHLTPAAAAALLAQTARVLQPGGVVVVVTPNCDDWWMLREGFWLDPQHVRPYPRPLLCRLARAAGLQRLTTGVATGVRYNDDQSAPRRLLNGFLNGIIGPHWNQGDSYLVAYRE